MVFTTNNDECEIVTFIESNEVIEPIQEMVPVTSSAVEEVPSCTGEGVCVENPDLEGNPAAILSKTSN